MSFSIRKFVNSDSDLWDQYINKHVNGSFFHLSGWLNVIESVFAHKQHYILAESNNTLVGVLPLFEQKSVLFGHALVSTPFCVYGGALANNDEIRRDLEQYAYDLGCKLNVDYVELRDRNKQESDPIWVTHSHHSTFASEIPANSEEILTSIKRKQRAVVRHSLKNELQWDNHANPNACFELYSESVRNLGTPVFSKKLFKTLVDVFPNQSETLIIKDSSEQAVSGVLSFYYKGEVLPYYGGGKNEARQLKSNDYMYYQLMHIAHEKGMTSFDFGRSKVDSGAYKYKKNWGMNEQSLNYKVALVKAKELPNLSPNNPKYQLFIKMWQKLPLPICRTIGPHISKYLG